MKAIIPAAGLGTRFLPATKSVPKEMLPVLDKPVIQYVVEESLAVPGCDGCIIVNSRSKELIEEHFTRNNVLEDLLSARGKSGFAQAIAHAGDLNVEFVYQDEPLGLGHAVHCAAAQTANEPFYVLLGDVVVPENTILPKLRQVSCAHDNASVIAVIAVPDSQVERFGIIAGSCIGTIDGSLVDSNDVTGQVWEISELVEKPALADAPSNLAIFGRYLLSPRVMELLNDQGAGAGNEIQLTDALERVLKEEKMYAVVIEADEGHDTGTIPNLIAANVKMARKDQRFAPALEEALS